MTDRSIAVLLHSRAFYPQIGGLERVSQILAEHLTALGHRITVLTDTPLGDADEVGPYRVVRGASTDQVRRLVAEADLVHVNGFSVQLVRHCWWARKPLIWTHQGHQAICTEGSLLHADSSCDGNFLKCLRLSARTRGAVWAMRHSTEILVRRILLRFARVNVAVSGWVASRINAPRCRVVFNPVDLHTLNAADKTPSRGTFSYFGRLVREKGVETFCHALALLGREGLHYSGRVVGDGPERMRLEALARELGISESVSFLGPLTGASLSAAFASAWIAVVPSLSEEPFGLVAVEAVACGTPAIVSRRGGLPEAAGAAAIHFENGSPQDLASAMRRLATDPLLWQRLAAAGPPHAAQFDGSTIAIAYSGLYHEALS